MVEKSHFKLFLAIALASGATRPRLEVSEHPPNPQLQELKIDFCGYRRPNYFFRLYTLNLLTVSFTNEVHNGIYNRTNYITNS